ncbi:molybdopterin-dependent oxidoreductase-like protein [Mucilaginibacter gracilis]|uniref:Molybdopterin-dependent oxidoreductase-like protein n=1 Tax=Mucilaginibacter gracilis TaxID=423350 RepID=A0A495JA70_9SPHI|nr:molybdopterin-dependent oxidoreductase [Mucilaginibacter gracilis]RKR84959.1 molybdopterin-dependent oxidoreductase-like protein [Mucilaginibacter gracilis]
MEQPVNQPDETPQAKPDVNPTPTEGKLLTDKQIKRRTFIAFGSFVALQATAYFGWRKLYTSANEVPTATAGAHKPLRRALNQTELFFRRLFYSNNHLVKTYPKEMAAKQVRHNSDIGLEGKFDPADWKLQIQRAPGDILTVTLDELKALPKTEIIFDFKCVEGWDQIQHWGGVKFTDFVTHFKLDKLAQMEYIGMTTPDKKYYIGLDTPSAMHPQTILAYEMNDKPLPPNHGAPLRLIIPVKYGIKNLKRIANITFSNTRPPDYWAERGYDYYSGL